MTGIAADLRSGRRRYQEQVETLLEQIRGQVQELRRLQVVGVRGPALADRKRELTRTRTTLAMLVGRDAPR